MITNVGQVSFEDLKLVDKNKSGTSLMKLTNDFSSIIQAISEKICIPPQPALLTELSFEIDKDQTNYERVGNIIIHDVALSAAVLKIVNSPYLGLPKKVQSIPHAISLLGINGTRNLAASFLLKKALPQNNKQYPRFWDEAARVADMCAFVAKEWNLMSPDIPFTLGLFHDVGIPLLAARYTDYIDTLKEANHSSKGLFTDKENTAYGLDHAVVACAITHEWGISESIREVILYHHDVDNFFYYDESEGQIDSKLLAVLKVSEYCDFFIKTGKSDADWERFGGSVMGCLNVSEGDIYNLITKFKEISKQPSGYLSAT